MTALNSLSCYQTGEETVWTKNSAFDLHIISPRQIFHNLHSESRGQYHFKLECAR